MEKKSSSSSRSRGSAGSRVSSRSSMSPQDLQLAGELQSANMVLESQEISSSSSSTEARDRLKEREAKERTMELIAKHVQPFANASSRSESEATGGSPSRRHEEPAFPMPESARDDSSGAGSGKPNTRSRSSGDSGGVQAGSVDRHTGSSSSSRTATGSGQPSSRDNPSYGDLEDKISKLEQSLQDRDEQALELLQSNEDQDAAGQIQLNRMKQELAAAVLARGEAETERNKLLVDAAGAKARHDSMQETERLERERRDAADVLRDKEDVRSRQDLLDSRAEVERLKAEMQEDFRKAEADAAHAKGRDLLNEDRILELEKALQLSGDRLQLAHEANRMTRGGGNIERDLRLQIHEMQQASNDNNKEMAMMRLELLGLRASDKKEKPSQQGSLPRRPRRRKQGAGTLDSIDEEDDELPETMSMGSMDDEERAQDCVSSAGGDLASMPDTTAAQDMINSLLKQLADERLLKQTLKAEHAGASAEFKEQLALLVSEMALATQSRDEFRVENEQLRRDDRDSRMKTNKQINAMQLLLRNLQAKFDDQTIVVKEQDAAALLHETLKEGLQEKLQASTEALRIAGLRLQDAFQQHDTEALRNQQEVNSLKLQLAWERKRGAGTQGDVEPEKHLEQRVQELQEERNLLLQKEEVNQVQFQLQIEELCREHASKLQEQKQHYDDQIATLQALIQAYRVQAPQLLHNDEDVTRLLSATTTASRPAYPELLHMQAASSQSSAAPAPPAASHRSESPSARSGSVPTGSIVPSSKSSSDPTRGIIWSILSLLPTVAAMLCSLEGAIIENHTPRAGIILRSANLIGKSFFSFAKDKHAVNLQRTVEENHLTEQRLVSETTHVLSKSFSCIELDTFGSPLNILVASIRLSGRYLVLLVERPADSHGQQSVASSDICPSDSASVRRQRPQLMRSEGQRTKLRASFFSSKRSARPSSSSSDSTEKDSSLADKG